MSRYRFIAAECGHCPVRRLCQVLGVPASGYYAWQTGQQRAVDPQTPAWGTALVKTFGVHQRRYGPRRLQVTLHENEHRVGRQRLRTAMRRRGLHALQPKAYTPRTTDSTHGLRCAPNRLLDQSKPTRANQVSGCPIARTCRWTAATGSCPAEPICALFRTWGPSTWWVVPSRAVGATMPEELITTALQRAFSLSRPPQSSSSTPTWVVPGRAASTAATLTAPSCTNGLG